VDERNPRDDAGDFLIKKINFSVKQQISEFFAKIFAKGSFI
jgi:hypothetical protein